MLQLLPMFIFMTALGVVLIIFKRLVTLRDNRTKAFSDIDEILKRRYNFTIGLINALKKNGQFDVKLLSELIQARTSAVEAKSLDQKLKAEKNFYQSLMNVLAASKNSSDISADEEFIKFQERFATSEKKIVQPQRFFNSVTTEYNMATRQFPGSLLAGAFNFREEDYFENEIKVPE